MRRLILPSSLAFALITTACASRVEVAQPTRRVVERGPDHDQVVAEVDGVKVTLGELDAGMADELARQKAAYESALYDARVAALNQKVEERLLASEAKRRGVSVDALLAAEVDAKVSAPSESEIAGFYEQYKGQMEGASLDEMRPRIQDYMQGEAKKGLHRDLIAGLRKTYGAKILLEPPRVEVEAKGPAKGPRDAKVTIVIFSDFECPFCARAIPALEQVEKTYGKDVRFVFRHYPLPFHQAARPAAEASSCAAEQDAFWPLHDHLFASGELGLDRIRDFLGKQGGFDLSAYDACLSSGRGAKAVEADLAAAGAVQVDGTPAFFINGVRLSGAQPFEQFQGIIDAELAR